MSVRLFIKLVNHSFQEFLIDRFTACVTLIFGLLFFALEIIAGFIFFNQVDNILGWTRSDYMLLIANATTVSFLYQTLFVLSHESLSETIIEGELDHILIRPISSLLFFSFYRIDISSFINLVIASAVQVYFTLNYVLSPLQVILYLLSIILTTYLVFLLNHMAVCTSFWFEKASSIQGVPEYLVEFASRPMVIYPNVIRFIFTWVVPILLGINLPVLIVKNEDYLVYLLWLVVSVVFGTIILKIIWNKGLSKYTSAN